MNVVSRKTADDFLEFMEVYTARYLLGDRPDAAVSKANKATKYKTGMSRSSTVEIATSYSMI